MEDLVNIIKNSQTIIIVALIVVVIILFIMLTVVFKSLNSLETRYKKFIRGTNNKNIEELITNYLDKIDKAKEETEYMKELYKSLNERLVQCIQKVSIIRYRAFEDVGSDLSFSIALLDQNNDGIIITGIYGRNESTTYAKPIDKGMSRYDLSQEEKQVLEECMSKSIK